MARFSGQPFIRVHGRVSGRMRVIPVRPVSIGVERYLVALRGDTHWARNLRASRSAELVEHAIAKPIHVTEVFGKERASAVGEYLATSTYGPTIELLTQRLPDPDEHPVFRIALDLNQEVTRTTA